ncbi:MAG: hypothetical protein S4CHLAM123_07740 [Chlamydiales bacterium]|nr:hypothetical protein [Chlamydiales bacterium]
MSIIRGEQIEHRVTLTPTRELHEGGNDFQRLDFVEEECRRAFQKGEELGEKVGYEKALGELKILVHLLQKMMGNLLEQKKQLLENLRPEVIEFSIKVCERVLRKELERPETLVYMIQTLLDLSAPHFAQEAFQIFLSPEDLQMLEKHVKTVQKKLEIRFRADPMMCRGDCRIETKTGLLNHMLLRELENIQEEVQQGA